jgi:RNA polymerase sigma-70 factor, ECF subfamily
LQTDPELLTAAAEGRREALDLLLERHLPGLKAFVRRRASARIRARERDSDIVQSVCRELVEGMDGFRYEGEAAFRNWLYTAAKRKLADRDAHWRTQKRNIEREVSGDDDGGDEYDGPTRERLMIECYHAFCSPSQPAIAAEQLGAVESALRSLSEEQRELILMSRVFGMTRAEIATRTGRSEAAIRNALPRALAALAEKLDLEP